MKPGFHADDTSPHVRVSSRAGRLSLWALPAALAFTLFPFGWLGQLWPAFGSTIDRAFPGDQEHALGHGALFFLLGLLALAAAPALRRRPWRYVGLLALAGLGQEAFQFLYKQRLLAFDDARDLATDLVGLIAALAVVSAWGWVHRRRSA
jgi:hypothetical protein